MNEDEVRKITAAHTELVAKAIELAEKHTAAIGIGDHISSSDFDHARDSSFQLTISGDIATLGFTSGSYDGAYATTFDFIAAVLWDDAALAEAIEGRAARMAEAEAVQRERSVKERKRTYELLRAEFEDQNAD